MISLEPGDCRDVLLEMAARGETFDACVTDPPYHLTSVVKRFGGANAAPAQHGTDGLYARQSRGFMGKEWDGGDVAFRPETWRLVFDVLKPGSHLLAFGGTRTFHRQVCAIEDAGFEIRDCVMWLYGTGFPKSHDVSKGIDKAAGAVREVVGSRKLTGKARVLAGGNFMSRYDDQAKRETIDITAPATPEAAAWSGWGTALKPGYEPVIVARKPLEGTVAANVLAYGTGALNIGGCRIEAECATGWGGGAAGGGTWDDTNCGLAKPGAARPVDGRWPANVIHDGSAEVLEAFAAYGESRSSAGKKQTPKKSTNTYGDFAGNDAFVGYADQGTPGRFFYSAKANTKDRAGSKHPTVKPVDLIRYLARLVTPPGGRILDPFGGSGTLLEAAALEGFNAVAIERDPEYQADILRRIASLQDMGDMLA